MKISSANRQLLNLCVVAAILSGCGGSEPPVAAPSGGTQPLSPRSPVQRFDRQHARYRLEDLGTLGGPSSSVNTGGQQIVNNGGTVSGAADTSVLDPNYPYTNPFFASFGADPYIQHAFTWRHGALRDIGALSGVNSSYGLSVSDDSVYVAGISTNGTIDSLTGYVEGRAVVWKGSMITDIGTFGGNESFASGANDRGDVAGSSANATADAYNFFGWGTQMHAFLWRNGTARDLGTLGGPDSYAGFVNQAGQVAGFAYINDYPNPYTGLPTFHPFLWEPRTKKMRDLGTIGGTAVFGLNDLNQPGEVVGNMTIAGDQASHGFLWNGKRLIDLGTLGGSNSSANALNDAGVAVGDAELPSGCSGPAFHAALWRKGQISDLGILPGTSLSSAFAVNSRDQIVGFSSVCDYSSVTAFLWEHGSMVDLNTLVSYHPDFYMFWALAINNRGEIVGLGMSSGNMHAFALIPCADNGDCSERANASSVSIQAKPVVPPPAIRAMMRRSGSVTERGFSQFLKWSKRT